MVVGSGGGGMNWEIGIDMYILICIKCISSKNLLYKKINKILKFKKKALCKEVGLQCSLLDTIQSHLKRTVFCKRGF